MDFLIPFLHSPTPDGPSLVNENFLKHVHNSWNTTSVLRQYAEDPIMPRPYRTRPEFYHSLLSRYGKYCHSLDLHLLVPTLREPCFSADVWSVIRLAAYEDAAVCAALRSLSISFRVLNKPIELLFRSDTADVRSLS